MIRWYVQGLAWTLVFYPTSNPLEAAAKKIASSFAVQNVQVWPTDEERIFRVQWYNPQTETFFDDYLHIYSHT